MYAFAYESRQFLKSIKTTREILSVNARYPRTNVKSLQKVKSKGQNHISVLHISIEVYYFKEYETIKGWAGLGQN